jgi:D-glycero-D-manno-heptose 1,7-bisphosphate phosphatase
MYLFAILHSYSIFTNVTLHPSSGDGNLDARRAVFLDRDGVINRMCFNPEFGIVDSPANPDQFVLCSGTGEAIASLKGAGFLVIVISNQPGIAKGKFTPALLKSMELKMVAGIAAGGGSVDAIYNCLHHPEAVLAQYRIRCDCRKPQPGLLLKAAREWNIDLAHSYMVGDGVTDIVAGCAVNLTTIFVNERKCYNCDSLSEHQAWPDYLVSNLTEAVTVIRSLEAGDLGSISKYVLRCA